MVDLLMGIQMEPPLTSSCGSAAVPGAAQGLITPIGKGDQILLKRVYAKCIGNFVLVSLTVRAIGAHKVFAIMSEKRRRHTVLLEDRIIEVAKDRGIVGRLHGEGVIGAFPRFNLPWVAGNTGLAADVGWVSHGRRGVRQPAGTAWKECDNEQHADPWRI